jgi:hypothetical protein
MAYGKDWRGDFTAVRVFAKAVASAIYHARMLKTKDKAEDSNKAWYDEVTLLRSASSKREFLDRVLILLEQGHREHPFVGTDLRGEAFNPEKLLECIEGQSFEDFRHLFRMYLIQESKPWVSQEVSDLLEGTDQLLDGNDVGEENE